MLANSYGLETIDTRMRESMQIQGQDLTHLRLGLQRLRVLLGVRRLGRQVELLALQVVDLALSMLSPLKEPPALLLHTYHP